jgi:hypothetical protein
VLLTFGNYYNIKTKQVNKIESIIYLASYTVLLIKKIYPLLISIFTIFVAILAYLQEISFLDLMELKTIDL